MSATVISPARRQPTSWPSRWLAGAIVVVSVATAAIALALATVMGDARAVAPFDPTAAQRIHHVREYGFAGGYDASSDLQAHLRRENAPASGGILFEHLIRENGAD